MIKVKYLAEIDQASHLPHSIRFARISEPGYVLVSEIPSLTRGRSRFSMEIVGLSEEDCQAEFNSQVSDGFFENFKVLSTVKSLPTEVHHG